MVLAVDRQAATGGQGHHRPSCERSVSERSATMDSCAVIPIHLHDTRAARPDRTVVEPDSRVVLFASRSVATAPLVASLVYRFMVRIPPSGYRSPAMAVPTASSAS